MRDKYKDTVNKLKQKIKKIPIVKKVEGTVLSQRIESKTPKWWLLTGRIAGGVASAGLAAAVILSPVGWMAWAVYGALIGGSLLGTWAGYQTDNDELKQLWKKPFLLLKKKV